MGKTDQIFGLSRFVSLNHNIYIAADVDHAAHKHISPSNPDISETMHMKAD